MANVYIEPRPKGRTEGSHIDDYLSKTMRTTSSPILKRSGKRLIGREITATPHVARVRHLNDKKSLITGAPHNGNLLGPAWASRRICVSASSAGRTSWVKVGVRPATIDQTVI